MMSDRFHDKYRIPSVRLRNWDYGSNGIYFITICTAAHDSYFGKIENKILALSDIGHIATSFWLEIPIHLPFIQLDTFIIMPNHMHGIIEIRKPDNTNNLSGKTHVNRNSPNDEIINKTKTINVLCTHDKPVTIDETGEIVETRLIASLQMNHLFVPSTNAFPGLSWVNCASLI